MYRAHECFCVPSVGSEVEQTGAHGTQRGDTQFNTFMASLMRITSGFAVIIA